MRFGPQPLDSLEDTVLAHTHRLATGVLKKGRTLRPEDVEAFRLAGYTEVTVARFDPDDVGEDAAAARLAETVAGAAVARGDAHTGRVNLFAEADGLLLVDVAVVDALNRTDERLTLATLRGGVCVRRGELVATVKVIPFAVPEAVLDRARAAVAPCVRVAPFGPLRAGLVLTRLPSVPESLLDRASQTQRVRLARLGGVLGRELRVPHRAAAVAEAIVELAADGCDPVLLLGASAITDRGDVIPSGLRAAGGAVEHLGMPVDPGNLLMLGRLDDTVVVGVPGCARSLKPSGFDHVLRRLAAGVGIGRADLVGLGHGGLLKETMMRRAPREGPPDVEPRIGAVVLAAGRSQRMGPENKLLLSLADGRPIVRSVAETALAADLGPVVVVTGHDDASVRAALRGLPLEIVHNPLFGDGMSTSLRAGVRALEGRVEAAFVLLGDMPYVSRAHLDALRAAFDPTEAKLVCVPVRGRRQGNPVLFSSRLFPEMARLEGDRGAKVLLAEHRDVVVEVPVDDDAVLVDLDTPEAFARARRDG